MFENRKIKTSANTLVKKSTEMARTPMQLVELNRGLNLRQQRFFNMALLAVDEKGVSEFSKADYDAIFKENNDNFFGVEVRTDIQALGSLGMQKSNKKEVVWRSVFVEVKYDKELSVYRFWWSPLMMEHVKNIQRSYIQQDLQVLAHFKNKYSFIWYDYFKSNFRQWKWQLSREELINLLRLENKKSYLRNHPMLLKQCIELPLQELNEFTEFKITVDTIKKGRVVVGYEFKRFTEKEVVLTVSQKQLDVLKEIVDRYGDTGAIIREIASFAVVNADAVPYLTELFFEIQAFKRYIAAADTFTAESFRDVVALAIQKDNEFKAKLRELYDLKTNKLTIDAGMQEQAATKPIFYNWLDERE